MEKGLNKKVVFTFIGFLILFVIAVVYRCMFLNVAFWYDEACSWATAIGDFPYGIMKNLLNVDLQHTPVYFFLLHFWIKIFGDSEFSIRFMSLLFSIASIPLTFVFANKISSRLIAVLSTAIVSVSPVLVLFSVEARMYPVALFLVLLSANYFCDVCAGKKQSKIKLLIANVFIPYTLVGGILYNLSLSAFGILYFKKYKKDDFKEYIKYVCYEWVLLIPYFVLIGYYAIQRFHFVIRHEGSIAFVQFVDLVRNLFSVITVPNLYWPDAVPIVPDFKFVMFAFVPCAYFVYGLFVGYRKSEGFLRVIYNIVILNFILFVACSYLQICVCTVRYILYLLPLLIVLSVIGLSKNLSKIHTIVFVLFFAISSMYYNVGFAKLETEIKQNAFKAVRIESDKLNLTSEDIVIMPFGSDAPYYFREGDVPRVLNFDLHKELRNPYNSKIYDRFQQKFMDKKTKYNMIYDRVKVAEPFSKNFADYFVTYVNQAVPSGRYVLLALFANDADSLINFDELQKLAPDTYSVKNNSLGVLLAKYLLDIRALLDNDFEFAGSEVVNNYTFLLYKKK